MLSQTRRTVEAAGLIMIAMTVSRILGYLRDVVIYAWFGQNRLTDAYQAAFSIPDFLYSLLVGGALSSAFIPVFSSYLATGQSKDAWKIASTILNLAIGLMILGIAVGMIYTPQLVQILVPGFDPESLELTVGLTRIMFFQTFFMALNGISMGILNSHQQFTAPALGSVVYNLGIIGIGALLAPYIGIAGFSVGVVAGAMLNFAVQLPALLRVGMRYSWNLNFTHPGVRRIMVLMLPVLIGLSVAQFNLFVNQNLASTLEPGIVAALRSAQRLMQLPIGIFAIAVAVAVFPTLTGQAARKERQDFIRTMVSGLRSVLFLTVPTAAGLIALRVPVVRFLFEQGKFTHDNTLATATALFYYSLGLFGYAANQVLNRAFYALQDTRTPVAAGIATIGLNIGLNYLLIGPLRHGGLALAYSIAGIFNMVVLLLVLHRQLGGINGRSLTRSFVLSVLAAAIMGLAVGQLAAYLELVWDMNMKLYQFAQVIACVGAGTAIFLGLAHLLRLEEMGWVSEMIMRKLRKRK